MYKRQYPHFSAKTHNKKLEDDILGHAAKYQARYGVKLYAFAIEGNHIQFPALFSKGNRADFMRDLNSWVARAVPRFQKKYPGGRLWGRRYSVEYLPGDGDVEELFYYTVLQPVQDGLVDDIARYPGYNCFEDAITGRKRKFKVVRRKEYNDAKRWRSNTRIELFTDIVELEYTRLPGYEELSQKNYEVLMRRKLKERTARVIESRKGRPCMGREALKRVRPGSVPHRTKTSTATDHRPRILSKNKQRLERGKAWYFSIYHEYREKSVRYRAGARNVEFPLGTYKPPVFTKLRPGTILDYRPE